MTFVREEFWSPENKPTDVKALVFYKDHYDVVYDRSSAEGVNHSETESVKYSITDVPKYNVADAMDIVFPESSVDPDTCANLRRIYENCKYGMELIWTFKGHVPVDCMPTEDTKMYQLNLDEFSDPSDKDMAIFGRYAQLPRLKMFKTTFNYGALAKLPEQLIYLECAESNIEPIPLAMKNRKAALNNVVEALKSVKRLIMTPCPIRFADEVISKLTVTHFTLHIEEYEIELNDGAASKNESSFVQINFGANGKMIPNLEKIVPLAFQFKTLKICVQNVEDIEQSVKIDNVLKWLQKRKPEHLEDLIIKISYEEQPALDVNLTDSLSGLRTLKLQLVRPDEKPLFAAVKTANSELVSANGVICCSLDKGDTSVNYIDMADSS